LGIRKHEAPGLLQMLDHRGLAGEPRRLRQLERDRGAQLPLAALLQRASLAAASRNVSSISSKLVQTLGQTAWTRAPASGHRLTVTQRSASADPNC
jgi:hypothetical protein